MTELRKIASKLIGLTGGKGVGKDTVAQHLVDTFGFRQFAFADPIRQALAAIFEVDTGTFSHTRNKELPLPELLGQTPRWLMQTLGTEWGRDLVSSSLWVDILLRKLEHTGAFLVVVSDVRFDSEALALRAKGGVIWKIVRDTADDRDIDVHRSEVGIDPRLVDTVIKNNSDKRMLYTQVGVAIANIDRRANRPDNSTAI